MTAEKPRSEAVYTVGVGVLFLSVIVGMLYVLLFVPMPAENEKPIMLICGGIMTAGVIALNNLARGGSQSEQRIRDLELSNEKLAAKVDAHQQTIDRLLSRMVPEPPIPRRIELKDS